MIKLTNGYLFTSEGAKAFNITVETGGIKLAIVDYRGTRDWTVTASGPAEILNFFRKEAIVLPAETLILLTRFSEQGWETIKHLSNTTKGGWTGSTHAEKVAAIAEVVDADLQDAVTCLLLNV